MVRGVRGVGWDESPRSGCAPGEVRHGLVLEVDRDLAVVQVLEGTEGMRPGGSRVRSPASRCTIPVGPGWLGRVCNGRGEPVDGGPPVLGRRARAVAGPRSTRRTASRRPSRC